MIRAKRLQDDPKYMFNEITKINNEALELSAKIIDNTDYIGEAYNIGNAMSFITAALENYFRCIKSLKDKEKAIQIGRERGNKHPEELGAYHVADAGSKLDDCKDSLKMAKKYLDEIKARISA